MTESIKEKLQQILGDKYDVEDMIYRGGMGEIYLGRHRQLNAKVAIKIMIEKLTDDPELKKRFHREAQLYANLRHPNIIHIYDFGCEETFDYMVFPFIDGETLKDRLEREGRIDPAEALNIVLSVAKALAHAADNNVIHRDVKPSNIMIEKNGNILIADFGISKDLRDIDITVPGTVLGSPKYMSPEQILGKPVDSRSDQYALGIIFLEMLSGKYPYEGDNPSALFYSHVNVMPEIGKDIHAAHPDFPRIIKKLIAKDPDERYKDFHELIDDLTVIQLEQTQVKKKLSSSPLAKKAKKKNYIRYGIAAIVVVLMLAGEYVAINYYYSPPEKPKVGRAQHPENREKGQIAGEAASEPVAESPQATGLPPQEPASPARAAEAEDYQASVPGDTTGGTSSFTQSAAAGKTEAASRVTVSFLKKLMYNFGMPDEEGLFVISTNKPMFRIGERIVYSITPKKNCYVVLYDFSTAGELIQLFPNRFTPDPLVRAGRTYFIPAKGSFEVTGPPGAETVIGFAADTPFSLLDVQYTDDVPFLMVTNEDPGILENIAAKMEILKNLGLVRKNLDFLITE